MVTIGIVDSPIGPASTIGPVAIVCAIDGQTAEVFADRDALPGVTRERPPFRAAGDRLFDKPHQERARRLTRAMDQLGGA